MSHEERNAETVRILTEWLASPEMREHYQKVAKEAREYFFENQLVKSDKTS